MATPTEISVPRFYYANGEKIALEPSRRFVAVRLRGEGGEEAAAEAAATLSRLTPDHTITVMPIPEYGIGVIAVDEAGATNLTPGRMDVGALRSVLDAAGTGLEAGPSVFELADLPESTAVIPTGEVIVQFKPGSAGDHREQLLRKHRPADVRQDDLVEYRYVLRMRDGDDAIEVANALHENDQVEYAEPNLVSIGPRPTGNLAAPSPANGGVATMDPLPAGALTDVTTFETEVDLAPSTGRTESMERPEIEAPAAPLNDPGLAQQWGLTRIRAQQAWEINQGSPNIIVAVLDEGCDIAHEDIAYALPGYDAFDNDNDPTPSGNDAHGTACAGIVSMRRNNARGGVGVAPGCRVLPVRIARGIGGGMWSTSALIVDRGIRTAVARGAAVLSNSYSLAPSSTVTQAFQFAATNGYGGRGCLIAAASGNVDGRGIIYPARLSPTIRGFLAVGASNQWDQRKSKTSLDGETWWGSSYGPELDVVAPGVQIYTADISGPAGYAAGNYVPNFNGTSSATPHVAGVAALVLSVDPNLRGWEVEEIIKMTARDLGVAGRDEFFGFGRVDARAAVEAAARVWSQVSVTPLFLGSGQDCFIRLNVRVYNSGINTVRINNITLRSLAPTGTAEVDRFEYRPNPGGTMLPRAGHDVRFPAILLRANGTRASWSYRYTINWSYTFWRPSAPGLPLGTMEPGGTAVAEEARVEGLGGADSGGALAPGVVPAIFDERTRGRRTDGYRDREALPDGDSISIDRQTREITIVIR